MISHFLVATAREFHGKKPGPTAGVIDSQTIKTTESGGISGYDAGKKTKGRKRHIVTDTLGFMVGLVVHSAGILPTVIDQNPCAHLRMPRDMIFHGWSMRLFQAWQHSATMSS